MIGWSGESIDRELCGYFGCLNEMNDGGKNIQMNIPNLQLKLQSGANGQMCVMGIDHNAKSCNLKGTFSN